MKKYWLLTRLMLKNTFASMNPFRSAYRDGKKNSKAMARTVGVVVLMLLGLGSILALEYGIYLGLDDLGQPMLLPGMALLLSMMLTLVVGLFQGLSELFQGKDAPFLAVLPMNSRQVFASRFTNLYMSELLINAVVCIPAIVFYIAGTKQVMPMALTALPVVLLSPLIPLSIVTVLSSLLMRVTFVSRHREVLVNILSVALALSYSVAITMMNSRNDAPQDQLVMMLSRENGALNLLLKNFPPVRWAMNGMLGDWGLLLLYVGVSLAAACAAILLCGPSYMTQALSAGERTVTRKASGPIQWKAGSSLKALHALEWKELLRTPAWATNSLLGIIMYPLMLGIGVISGFSSHGGLTELRGLVGTVDQAYVALIAAAGMSMGSMVNPAVSTAISREGGRWPMALTLPVRQQTRFLAKFLMGLEINLVCTLLIAGVVAFLTALKPLWLLAALAVAVLLAVAGAASGLWLDAMHPQLSWSSETEAIKKNYNQVFGMLLWFIFLGLCAVPAVLLWSKPGWALAAVLAVALAEAAVSSYLLTRTTKKHLTLIDA